jgi:hypothetical protein
MCRAEEKHERRRGQRQVHSRPKSKAGLMSKRQQNQDKNQSRRQREDLAQKMGRRTGDSTDNERLHRQQLSGRRHRRNEVNTEPGNEPRIQAAPVKRPSKDLVWKTSLRRQNEDQSSRNFLIGKISLAVRMARKEFWNRGRTQKISGSVYQKNPRA